MSLAVVQGGVRRVALAYGRKGLTVNVDARADVIEPRHLPGLEHEAAVVRASLREPLSGPPLRELVRAGDSVGISVCDVTRPFPGARILPVLFEELHSCRPGPITLYIATGTHRACTADELALLIRSIVTSDSRKTSAISGAAICSVVPQLTPMLFEACKEVFNSEPLLVLPDARVAYADVVGKAHIKMRLAGGDATQLDAIAFRAISLSS